MSSNPNHSFDERIGNGSGLINPNSEDFRILREKIEEYSTEMSSEERMALRIKGLKYRIESYLNNPSPDKIIPAGSFLKEMVEIIQVAHKDFAAYIGYKNSNLSALYKGSRRINHDLAMKLGYIFNMDPALWLNLQNKVELLAIHQQNEHEYQKYQLSDLLKRAG